MELGDVQGIAVLREGAGAWEARLADALRGRVASPLDELTFLQAPSWAKNKELTGWGSVRLVATAPDGSWAGAQFLLRRLPLGLGAIAYAPRGPLVIATDVPRATQLRAALLRGARDLRADGVTLVRIEPGEARPLVAGDDEVHPPARVTEPLRAPWFEAARLAGVELAPAHPVQPRSSRRIDLARGGEAVRADWGSSCGKYVRKAASLGVTMRLGGTEDADAFLSVMVAIADRTGVKTRSRAAFAHLVDSFSGVTSIGVRGEFSIATSAEGRIVGGLLLVSTATTTTEIFGGATNEGNELRVPYLLKGHAIDHAMALGSRTYDMWGISTAGIGEFKAKWGGVAYAYPGGFDLAVDPARGRLARRALSLRGFGG